MRLSRLAALLSHRPLSCSTTELHACSKRVAGVRHAHGGAGTAASQRSNSNHDSHDAPVIIAGAGPTGLTLALLLAKHGVRSVVVERSRALTQHPQAHFINNRTMEVFQPLWGLADEVSALMPPLEEWRRFVYCTSMGGAAAGEAGGLIGLVDHFQGQEVPQMPHLSPVPVAHLPQSRLLPLLMERCRRAAPPGAAGGAGGSGQESLIQVLMGHAVTGFEQSTEGVRVRVSTGEEAAAAAGGSSSGSGGSSNITLSGRYLVAADGVHSGVRRALGIPLEGQPGMQHLVNIHFNSRQLGHALLHGTGRSSGATSGGRNAAAGSSAAAAGPAASSALPNAPSAGCPGMLYFVFNSRVVAVIVAHDLQRGEFVAQVPYFPPLQSLADFPPDVCAGLVAAAAGMPLSDVRVLQARAWTMGAVVAGRYRSGRVLLAGDAAHAFPPAGGFGMNTGVQDAHNLAWKLAAVLQGAAGEVLLDSYEAERRPVAQANAALSIANWKEAIRVPQLLGLDPRAADMLNKAASSLPLPTVVGKSFLQAGLTVGRTIGAFAAATTSGAGTGGGTGGISGAAAGVLNPLAPWQRARLQELFASGETLRLQFPKEDLGFRYQQEAGAAVVEAAGAGGRGSRTTANETSKRGAPYVPSTEPGCRLPHCWLQRQQEQGEPALVSTLQVVADATCASAPGGGARLLLLVDCTGSSSGPGSTGSSASSPSAGTWSRAVSAWRSAAAAAAATGTASTGSSGGGHGLPLVVARVVPPQQQAGSAGSGSSGTGDAAAEAEAPNQATRTSGGAGAVDGGDLVLVDVQGSWGSTMGLAAGGALLVRPDGHVAWKCALSNSSTGEVGVRGAAQQLAAALEAVLRPGWKVEV